MLYCTVLYCTVLYCAVLYCTVLYCTVLYCTVLLQVVVYDGYRPGDETIHHFWEVLLHYSELMQKKFLLFTTGQCFVIRDHIFGEDPYQHFHNAGRRALLSTY